MNHQSKKIYSVYKSPISGIQSKKIIKSPILSNPGIETKGPDEICEHGATLEKHVNLDPLQNLASRHGAKIVRSIDEINGCAGNLSGLSLGLLKDIAAGPELLINYFGRQVANLFEGFSFNFDNEQTSAYPDAKRRLWLIPGYSASSRHLGTMCEHLGNFAKPHPELTSRRITGRVMDDALILASSIKTAGRIIELGGHSRGGLVALCALQILQDLGVDYLIARSILLSPTSMGVRPEISALAKHLNINAIDDLCVDSKATKFWQRLNRANRAKVQIVSPEGGDAFTSPEKSFVPGGIMFLTPPCGHQDAVRNPKTPYFQLTVDLIKHAVVSAN